MYLQNSTEEVTTSYTDLQCTCNSSTMTRMT